MPCWPPGFGVFVNVYCLLEAAPNYKGDPVGEGQLYLHALLGWEIYLDIRWLLLSGRNGRRQTCCLMFRCVSVCVCVFLVSCTSRPILY